VTNAKRAASSEGDPLQSFRLEDSRSKNPIAHQARRRRPEDGIHIAVCEHLRLRAKPNVVWLHVPNGGTRNPREAARFKPMGVLPGASDLLLWHQGNAFALELKAPGGRLSEAQLEFLARFNDAGGHSASAEGLDRALAVLQSWGLLRGRAS
jgi:VRR-NUC domain